jgi:hypothetical protein
MIPNLLTAQLNLGDNHAYLNANNWSVRLNTSGSNGHDSLKSETYFSIDTLGAIQAFALWYGGMHGRGEGRIHATAEQFRMFHGRDINPGPLTSKGTQLTDSARKEDQWDMFFKMNDFEINDAKNGVHSESIENWPGNGIQSFGESSLMADFFDLNNNGIYEPKGGDYPTMRGNQMLYSVFNDDVIKTQTGSPIMGVEVQQYAYAFNCKKDHVLQNTFFLEYNLINKSANNYDSFFVALWQDVELGEPTGTAMGSIVNKAGFYFDLDNINSSLDSTYMVSVYPVNESLNSFLAYDNNSLRARYHGRKWYYDNMSSQLHNKDSICTIGDSDHVDIKSTSQFNFIYPDNPFDTAGWNFSSSHSHGFDVSGVAGVGPYQFKSGDTIKVIFAISGHWKYNDNPEKQYFNMIDEIDHVKQLYADGKLENACPTPLGLSKKEDDVISVYPNPTKGVLNIESDQEIEKLELFNSIGQKVFEGIGKQINCSQIPNGIYVLKIRTTENKTMVSQVIKR